MPGLEPLDQGKDNGPDDPGCGDGDRLVGNPCDAATGNKIQYEGDYLHAPGQTDLDRYYNSRSDSNVGLGYGWSSTISKKLAISGTLVFALRVGGQRYAFQSENGQWVTDSDIRLKLVETSTEFVLTLLDGTTEHYHRGTGSLLYEIHQNGQRVSHQQVGGRTESVTGPFGHVLAIGYDTSGRVSTITDPANQAVRYGYDANNNLTRVDYPDSTAKLYHYENPSFPNHLTGVSYIEADGTTYRYATYAYDANGKANVTEHAGGYEHFGLNYDSESQTTVTDAAGTNEVMTFATNLGVKNLTSKVNQGDGKSVAQTFDANNNLTCKKDEEGRVTTFGYNATNQKTGMTEGLSGTDCNTCLNNPTSCNVGGVGRVTTYEYHPTALDLPRYIRRPSVAAGQTFEIEIVYGDARFPNLPTAITQRGYTPSGTSVSRTVGLGYNASGQVNSIDGPRTDVSDVTTLEYYECTTGGACGQLKKITNALGHITTFDLYDPAGRLTQMTDPNGLRTNYSYDARGRVRFITQTPPAGSARTTEYRYNAAGDVTFVAFPDGRTLTYDYDDARLLRTITDNLGNYVSYGYDLRGNRNAEHIYDASGVLVRQVDMVHDLRNRLKEISAPASPGTSLTQRVYDAVGNLSREVDPNNNPPTQHQHDSLNRLFQTVDRLNGVARYGYDVNDRLKQVVAPNNATTAYEYDDLGNLRREISPDRGTTVYDYDPAGNLKTATDARNIVASYTYDALNRVTLIDYPGSTEDVTYSYDAGANCTLGIGRLCRVSDESGTTEYGYDAFGNVTLQRKTELSVTYTLGYSYDAADRIATITYSDNRVVNYGRDALGRIREVSTTVNGSLQSIVSNRLYRADGRLAEQTFGNGLNEIRQHDLQGRLTHQFFASVDTRVYDYDPNGNLTRKQSLSGDDTYGYDPLDRLNGEFYDVGPYTDFVTRGHDANGNWRGEAYGTLWGDVPFDGQYSDGLYYDYQSGTNRLAGAGQWECCYTTYEYDASGNLASFGVALIYNAANRLARLTYGGSDYARYTYDHRGLRTRKVTGGRTTLYHYDMSGRLLAETSAGGQTERLYLYADDAPIAQIDAGANEALHYLHVDHLNTPRLATDAAQTATWRLERMVFGNLFPQEDPDRNGIPTRIALRAPGQYEDAESGFFYNHHRYLWEAMGRYIASDPIGLAGSLNTYTYVENNPLRWIDPLGLAEIPNPNGVVPGGPWTPAGPGQAPGTFFGPKQPSGPRSICRYVPDAGSGGPKGATEPYWKTQNPGQNGWNRYDLRGNPITPEQSHLGRGGATPIPIWLIRIGTFIGGMTYSAPAY
jgi:RHS repeat-associated protein